MDFKTFKILHEDTSGAPTNSSSSPAIASSDAARLMNMTRFMNHPCVEVDDDTYMKCHSGKEPFKRWVGYITDTVKREVIKQMYNKNSRMIVKNQKTGAMTFLK